MNRKFISTILAVLFFLNGILIPLAEARLVQKSFSPLPSLNKKKFQSLLSSIQDLKSQQSPYHFLNQYGTVRSVIQNDSPLTIINIQDIHGHPEVQENIEKAVSHLIREDHVDLIALEGAFEELDLKPFQNYPHREIIQTVADQLLKEKKMTGAVHAGILSNKSKLSLVGVDDLKDYKKNIQAYRDAQKQSLPVPELIPIKLNPRLMEFDFLVQSYRDKKITIGPYLSRLTDMSDEAYPAIEIFLSAWQMEKKLRHSEMRDPTEYIQYVRLAKAIDSKKPFCRNAYA